MKRIICLGNRSACVYKKHALPPPDMPLDKLNQWAEFVCDLDISGIPNVGDPFKDTDGNTLYTVTEGHRRAFLMELIERPILAATLTGSKLCTRIHVSDDSSFLQAVAECLTVWRGDGRNGLAHAAAGASPAWISGTDAGLVAVLKDELKIPEVREYEEEGK